MYGLGFHSKGTLVFTLAAPSTGVTSDGRNVAPVESTASDARQEPHFSVQTLAKRNVPSGTYGTSKAVPAMTPESATFEAEYAVPTTSR